MADPVPSILTRTQRDRLRSAFEGVDGAKRRRDERKIRARVSAGVDDFELLVEYPDRQFELAFQEHSQAELRARLADATLTVERIRALHDVDRESVVEAARDRRAEVDADDTATLERVPLRTREERREHVAVELADEYRPGRWKRISDALLKVGLALVALVSLLAVVAPDFTQGLGSVPGIVGAGLLVAGLGIVGVRGVKYDLLPAARRSISDPAGTARAVWDRF
ncbi:ABC transporter permease [Halorarum halobium]|uniref:ABC transporter permease n=1 Tax=Halorarum halobium TaxID=3075121 RepID=UPI0028A59D40|nr:ABC transporter permease [Halobaculum sp. XH14]